MPAMSWKPDLVLPTPPDVERIITQITMQAKVKYDRYANNCYYNNLVLISPTAFDAIRRKGVFFYFSCSAPEEIRISVMVCCLPAFA